MPPNRIIAAMALLSALATTAPAAAHVKTAQGTWLFTGSTYSETTPHPEIFNRSDPVNVIWRGPSGASVSISRVLEHVEADWTDRRIPGQYPRGARMRPRANPLCADPQYVFMRDGDDKNSGDWTQSLSYMSTNGVCGNQYHTRLFDDSLHTSLFPGSENQEEWVLTPIHHERVRFLLDHEIDLPWDQARSAYIHAMKVHCSERGWAMHDESATDYGRFPNSGIISRISIRHRSVGCEDA
jgi:hypothetical protein